MRIAGIMEVLSYDSMRIAEIFVTGIMEVKCCLRIVCVLLGYLGLGS
jgi:hypothetical protein